MEHPPPAGNPYRNSKGSHCIWPGTAVQGVTDYGTIGYTGPCPPHGQMIRYQFKVYGLDAMLDLKPGSDKHQLIGAMKGHVVQFGETVAICTR